MHRGRGYMKNLCTFSQSSSEPKTALKNKVLKKLNVAIKKILP